jgi:hypothetical protein
MTNIVHIQPSGDFKIPINGHVETFKNGKFKNAWPTRKDHAMVPRLLFNGLDVTFTHDTITATCSDWSIRIICETDRLEVCAQTINDHAGYSCLFDQLIEILTSA